MISPPFFDFMKKKEKRYILKPGNHQFAPNAPAIHSNENLSDEEARWYLSKYPHIKKLFVQMPGKKKAEPNNTIESTE